MRYVYDVNDSLDKLNILNYDVLDSIADWVRVVDTNNTIIYANRAMKRELDKDIVGKRCHDTYLNHDKNICITTRSIETGQIIQKEVVINDKIYSAKSSPIVNDSGEIIAAVEVFRDVTRERKLEQEVSEKSKMINSDISLAKSIQTAILPTPEETDIVSFDYIYNPSNMLSGDIFDIYEIGSGCVGVYICDVAGHGVAASIMTMFIRQTMRTISHYNVSSADTLSFLLQKFLALDLNSDSYFTILYGIYDSVNKTFKYSNAGHNCAPFLFDDEDNLNILENNGYPIISVLDHIDFEEKSVKVKAGDKILLYTDGLTEAKNKQGIEFGEDRVKQLILDNKTNLLSAIEESLHKYIWKEQVDDFAAVLIEIE